MGIAPGNPEMPPAIASPHGSVSTAAYTDRSATIVSYQFALFQWKIRGRLIALPTCVCNRKRCDLSHAVGRGKARASCTCISDPQVAFSLL